MYVKKDFMKIILLNIAYLAASVMASLYDLKRSILPATDRQDRKKSSDNGRFKKDIVQFYPPKNPEK